MSFLWIVGLIVVVVVTAAVGQGTNELALISTWIFFPAAIALYFAPSVVAATRKHPNTMSIFLLDLFLGWTLIGWIGALSWAYAAISPSSGQTDLAEVVASHSTDRDLRTCPYCAEDIRHSAIKCRHCGSELEAERTDTAQG
jgi:hypothetical protein